MYRGLVTVRSHGESIMDVPETCRLKLALPAAIVVAWLYDYLNEFPGWTLDRLVAAGTMPQQILGVYPAATPPGWYNPPGLLLRLTPYGRRTLEAEIYRWPTFPQPAATVAEALADDLPGMLADRQQRRGAPPLACNIWLDAEMRRLPDPQHYYHLYSGWLERYYTLLGYYPADPQRSFRAAATSCLRRLKQQP
jgi:hypothetical protein